MMTNLELEAIIRPIPQAIWSADFPLADLDNTFKRFSEDYGAVNFTPDFQRGHVWTDGQRLAFCESLLRGLIPSHLLFFQFNCPHWDDDCETDLPCEIQCVDGLQRITALRMMVAGDIKPFGLCVAELKGTPFSVSSCSRGYVKIGMHNFKRKADLLRYYLDINGGGTPHTAEELNRVRSMIGKEIK